MPTLVEQTPVVMKKFYAHVAICHNPMAKIATWVNDDLWVRAVNEEHAREKIRAIAKRRNWWIRVIFTQEESC